MAYHILGRILTFLRIPLVYGSSAPLDNILYHKDAPMIIQSLGSSGYLSLIYSLITHSITIPTVMPSIDMRAAGRRLSHGCRI